METVDVEKCFLVPATFTNISCCSDHLTDRKTLSPPCQSLMHRTEHLFPCLFQNTFKNIHSTERASRHHYITHPLLEALTRAHSRSTQSAHWEHHAKLDIPPRYIITHQNSWIILSVQHSHVLLWLYSLTSSLQKYFFLVSFFSKRIEQ